MVKLYHENNYLNLMELLTARKVLTMLFNNFVKNVVQLMINLQVAEPCYCLQSFIA